MNNSLNLPCAADVIGRIVKFVEGEKAHER